MAQVNLRSWPEISQAADELQLSPTDAAMLEHILVRMARIGARLDEFGRRLSTVHPPPRPEPDPPDGPPLHAAAQPPYTALLYCSNPAKTKYQPPSYQPPLPPYQTDRYTTLHPSPIDQQLSKTSGNQKGNQPVVNANSNWNSPPLNQPSQHVQPWSASYWDLPGSRNPRDFQPYELPPYGYEPVPTYAEEPYRWQHSPYAYNQSGQQDREWRYQLHRPSLPPLPSIKLPTSCSGAPGYRDHFAPPQFDQPQSPPPSMHCPTFWDPHGQQGCPEYEIPPPIDLSSCEGRSAAPLPATTVRNLMKREEESESSCLDVQIDYSCDNAGISHCFSERQMVEVENCDEPYKVLSTDSILEIEAKEDIVRDVSSLDIGDVSSATMGLLSDTQGTMESRDGSLEGQRVSAFQEIYLPSSPDIVEEALFDNKEGEEFLAKVMYAQVRGLECRNNKKVDHIELLRVSYLNFVTSKGLVKHSHPIRIFLKDDHPHAKELISMQVFFKATDGEGTRLILEPNIDGVGKVTLEDLEFAMASKNFTRSYAKEFMKYTRRSSLLSKCFCWKNFASVIVFDPGWANAKLVLSLTLLISWFPP